MPSPAASKLGLTERCAPIFSANGKFLSSHTGIRTSTKKSLFSLIILGISSAPSHRLHSVRERSVNAKGVWRAASFTPNFFTPAKMLPPSVGGNIKAYGGNVSRCRHEVLRNKIMIR
eukprot:CCRYP_010392-RF/>CCRYP_010392-RF protein AED:0.48 eAED:1.00 QI:0/0/0/1/0/0/2/0/116